MIYWKIKMSISYRQTALEAKQEFEAQQARDVAWVQSVNERINHYHDNYLPLFFRYCEAHGVDSVEPEIVFNWAGVPFMDAPTADDYLFVSLSVH
jgi:hypothetical protein